MMASMTETKSPLNVAIIGAGIGGLALAIGLLKEKVPFTLYERAACYSTVGAGVGLGPNALRAMEAIDPRFKKLYDTIATGNLTPNREHVMMDMLPLAPGLGGEDFVPIPVESDYYIRTGAHRKDLLDIMTSLIPAESVKFSKRVSKLEQRDGKVTISFEDGEVVVANAVIGCDGAKGATRGAVLAEKYPDQVKAKYSGKYVYRSMVPMNDAKQIIGKHAGDGKWFMGNGANFTTFSVSNGTLFNIVAFKFNNEKEWTHDHWTKEVTKEEMLADFTSIKTGVDSRLVRLLEVNCPRFLYISHADRIEISGQNRCNGLFITIQKHQCITTAPSVCLAIPLMQQLPTKHPAPVNVSRMLLFFHGYSALSQNFRNSKPHSKFTMLLDGRGLRKLWQPVKKLAEYILTKTLFVELISLRSQTI
jgi:2-polyprenyl-6-methoxyphenol hydroxylase-like FAD-dependent oxidoreductase